MNNKIKGVVYLIAFILMIVSARALEFDLQINPTYQNITVNTNQEIKIPVTFTLYGTNETIYNISLISSEPSLSFNMIPEIRVGTAVTSNLTIKTSTAFNRQIQVKFRGYYPIQLQQQTNTFEINITPSAFSPSTRDIYQSDSIVFRNIDTLRRHIYSSNFNTQINPNEAFSYTFNNIGTSNVCDYDFVFLPCAFINVLNRTYGNLQFYEPNDRYMTLDLNSILEETNIDFTMSIYNFSVDYNSGVETMITVSNTGSKEAKNVRLSGNWFSFNPNYFNVPAGSTKLVIGILTPYVTLTNNTNITYINKIKLSSDNTAPVEKDFSVFVNYHMFTGSEDTSNMSSWWNQKVIFCRENPNSTLCLGEPQIFTVYINNWSEGSSTMNISHDLLNQLIRDKIEQDMQITRLEGRINQWVDEMNMINNLTSSSMGNMTEAIISINETTESTRLWIIFGFVMVSIISFGTAFYLFFKNYMRIKNKLGDRM